MAQLPDAPDHLARTSSFDSPRAVANTGGDTGHSIHAAIIMDGSGRWACARGLPRSAGHYEGVEAVRRTVAAAPSLGIGTLTLHAFSSDNWQRPSCEVRELMDIFEEFLRSSVAEWVDAGIRASVIGRRDRLEPALVAAIEAAEAATQEGRQLHLRLAIDYSARDAIFCAARSLGNSEAATPAQFTRLLAGVNHDGTPVPDLDLLIRTGGEQRLSDFMLWECAYAELVFTDRMWPDFEAADLEAAVREFRSRHRRFGRVPETVPAGA
ncbi:MAG TPA: polyprenyl diphosphate synthase [Terracidiphilus sp.]|jgi:undecaprenyl diphosphate synthase